MPLLLSANSILTKHLAENIMRIYVTSILVLFGVHLCRGSGATSDLIPQVELSGSSRLKLLLGVLREGDSVMRRRAVMELVEARSLSSAEWKRVVAEIARIGETDQQLECFTRLSAVGSQLIAALVSEADTNANLDVRENILVCIGRMHTNAVGARDWCLRQLQSPSTPERLTCSMRIVLAAIDPRHDEYKRIIGEAFVRKGEISLRTARTMAFIGWEPWANQDMVEKLIGLLDSPTAASSMSAVALGAAGYKAQEAKPALKLLLSQARQDSDLNSLQIIYGLAVFKIDSVKETNEVKAVLSYIARSQFIDRGDLAAIFNSDLAYGDKALLNVINSALKDEDAKIHLGSIRMLGFSGPDGKVCIPRLWVLAQESSDALVRIEAYRTLGLFLPTSQISKLEACEQMEAVTTVKDAIRASIRLMRLER